MYKCWKMPILFEAGGAALLVGAKFPKYGSNLNSKVCQQKKTGLQFGLQRGIHHMSPIGNILFESCSQIWSNLEAKYGSNSKIRIPKCASKTVDRADHFAVIMAPIDTNLFELCSQIFPGHLFRVRVCRSLARAVHRAEIESERSK